MGDLLGANSKPAVTPETPVQKVILEISSKRLGATAVLSGKTLKGVITDGDIRRMLERGADIHTTKAKDIMNPDPKSLDVSELAVNGFHMMESKQITQIVVTKNGQYEGIVHLHDILKEGIF